MSAIWARMSGVGMLARAGSVLGATLVLFAAPALGQLSPKHPRVQKAVERALAFLEKQSENRVGGKALVGLTFVKAGRDESHPKVKEALDAVQAQARRGAQKITLDIYSTGISLMFLVALNPSRYRSEIEIFARSLHYRQKPAGAWGYPRTHPTHGETCDTSMTQYAVLGLWEAEDQAGVETPAIVWNQVARWLLRTQDPSGGFGYQGKPSYAIGERVKQSGVRHSLTVAALGSLYITKDRVGYRRLKRKYNDGLPKAFVLVEDQQAAPVQTDIPLRTFGKVISAANRWVEKNYDVNDLKTWIHYSLYALERYESLRNADVQATNLELSPAERNKWYVRGARYLLKTQAPDGHWESNAGPVPDTCFGALFLMGSTRKTLERTSVRRYRGGEWKAGRELPPGSKLRVRDGKVVVMPLEAPLPRVLEILLKGAQANYAAAVEALADAARFARPEELRQHADALKDLLHVRDTEVAKLATLALQRAGDLDAVPELIEQVETGKPELAKAAAEALEVLARSEAPATIDDHSDPETRRRVAEHWRAWFRDVRPEMSQ